VAGMNERERPDDPAEGADDPEVYEESNTDDTDIGIDDIGEALPGAGRMNEDPDDPDASDPTLRPSGQAPLP
jgi:hypothetical protein